MKPINTIAVIIIVLASAAGWPIASAAPMSLTVTVVGAESNDSRWHAVDEAVEFWNQQLTSAEVGVRLGPITRLIEPVSDDTLRRLSAVVVGGQGGVEPDIPEQFRQMPGDIVVALSTADLVSFALRWRPERRGLVAVRRADIPPLSSPNVPRNVVAHEFGHVLGLRHNSDPTTLMCGRPAPCRPAVFVSDEKKFFPLTATEIATLQARWQLGNGDTAHRR
jgi:Matrixin